MKTIRRQRGYTFFEITLVLAILLIMLTMVVMRTATQADRAKLSRAQLDTHQLAQGFGRMKTDTSVTTAACLTDFSNLTMMHAPPACTPASAPGGRLAHCAVSGTPDTECWGGPYFTRVGTDPWNNAYEVSLDPVTSKISVRSAGPNGIAHDGDDITADQ